MINNASKLLIISCALATAGCTSLPQAGLVYSSTAIVGVGMKVSTADAMSPVDITIGFKMHDFAYVPVAVQESRTPVGGASGMTNNSVEKIWASHAQSEGANAQCDNERKNAAATLKSQRALSAQEQAALEIACDIKRDAMSVYGQFNGTGSASGADRGAGLAVGKIFSTGVAAQNVSNGVHATAMRECVTAVKSTLAADATPEVQQKRIDQLCLSKR